MNRLVNHPQGPLGSKPGSCQADPARRGIVVMVTDSCPECASNQLDLQALTWEKVWRLSLPVNSEIRILLFGIAIASSNCSFGDHRQLPGVRQHTAQSAGTDLGDNAPADSMKRFSLSPMFLVSRR